MDTTALVKEAHKLIQLMDSSGFSPQGAVLVNSSETGSWRLWIIPPNELVDKKLFYGKISSIIVDNQSEFSAIDAGDVDQILADHPAIGGISQMFKITGFSEIHVSGSTFNGFYIPEMIVLRMSA